MADFNDLRRQAEEELKKQAPVEPDELTASAKDQLIEELRIHPVELEIQNRHLREAQQQHELSRERYVDLYDTAPVGYLTLDRAGLILAANLTGAAQLGLPRLALLNQYFVNFVARADRDTFYLHLRHCTTGQTRQACELQMITQEGSSFAAHLESTPEAEGVKDSPKIRTVLIDITARKQMEAERSELLEALSRQHKKLRTLSARLAEVQESERRQLARELHDKVGQNLTALNLNLGFVHANIPETVAQAELLRTRLSMAIALVSETTDSIRDVMAELRPPLLDENGLVDALKGYAERFMDWAGVQVTVQVEPLVERLPPAAENALFRIAQEALTNVAKHAQATEVTLSVRADDHAVQLTIVDNGVGFSLPTSPHETMNTGWGLLTMAERAEMVGGWCRIEPRPGQGVRVDTEVPRTGHANRVGSARVGA